MPKSNFILRREEGLTRHFAICYAQQNSLAGSTAQDKGGTLHAVNAGHAVFVFTITVLVCWHERDMNLYLSTLSASVLRSLAADNRFVVAHRACSSSEQRRSSRTA